MWFEVLKVNLSIVPLSFLSPLVVSEDGPSDAIAFNRMISRERSQEKKKKKKITPAQFNWQGGGSNPKVVTW